MSTVKELFEFEARNLDPLYQQYRAAPSQQTGGAYVPVAMNWLASAQRALQSASIADAYTVPLGARYNVVVGNVNRITQAGHSQGATAQGFLSALAGEIDSRTGALAQGGAAAGQWILLVIVGLVALAIASRR